MLRKAAYISGVLGLAVPAIFLLDLSMFHGRLSEYTLTDHILLILVVWPSSFLLSGFHGMGITVIVGILISIGINVLLYLGIGVAASRLWALRGNARNDS
jgi:hypothetical protein